MDGPPEVAWLKDPDGNFTVADPVNAQLIRPDASRPRPSFHRIVGNRKCGARTAKLSKMRAPSLAQIIENAPSHGESRGEYREKDPLIAPFLSPDRHSSGRKLYAIGQDGHGKLAV